MLDRIAFRFTNPFKAYSLRTISLIERYALGNILIDEERACSLSASKSTPSALEISKGITVFLVVGALAVKPPVPRLSNKEVLRGLPSGGVSSRTDNDRFT